MGRLTKADIESIKNTLEKLRTETMDTHGRISLIDDENIYEAINAVEKLAHYEDMEEQGRLIELPCTVGDTVWDIAGAEIREQIVDGIECRTDGFYIYANEDEWLGKINELVFLTKEEAEAKLKELKPLPVLHGNTLPNSKEEAMKRLGLESNELKELEGDKE